MEDEEYEKLTGMDENTANLITGHEVIHCKTCESYNKNGCGTSTDTIMACINR